MRLGLDTLRHPRELRVAGVRVPSFDVDELRRRQHDEPHWLHVGPGNLFRVHPARLAQDLMEAGGPQCGIAAVAPRDPARMDITMGRVDLLTLGVTLHADGTADHQVIASVCEGLAHRREADRRRIREIAESPSLQMITMTITEKGYQLRGFDGSFQEAVEADLSKDPRHDVMTTTMAMLAALLVNRFDAGAHPIALVSLDNFSHNGDKLRDSVLTVVRQWSQRGTIDEDVVRWIVSGDAVAFPISVIDKITPGPSRAVADRLAELGFENLGLDTSTGTPMAAFVNTEPAEYLVVEDSFPAGRPALEKAGVHFTDRDTCDRFERMKVTTCLNPLHTALAVTGVLLGCATIDEEMKDPGLAGLVHRLGWVEGLPVVTDPGIVDPREFLREVEEERFPNPFLGDTPGRIATDTSQKLPIRFGETIKSYLASEELDISGLVAIPFVLAAWCRYLMGIDDHGDEVTLSPDPLLDDLTPVVAGVRLGEEESARRVLGPILSRADIFGVDLTTTPLAGRVEEFFIGMTAGPGAVRTVLDKEFAQS